MRRAICLHLRVMFFSAVVVTLVTLCCSYLGYSQTKSTTQSQPHYDMPWLKLNPKVWFFEPITRKTKVEKQVLAADTRVIAHLYSQWTLAPQHRRDGMSNYAEVTDACGAPVDSVFMLTDQEWLENQFRLKYYRQIDALINELAGKAVRHVGLSLKKEERAAVVNALKALAWQESRWQHYYTDGERTFVLVSKDSFNALGDWGITQIARSGFKAEDRLNANFFHSKGFCSLKSSLYYGFLQYIYGLKEAIAAKCNQASFEQQLLGAYNRYSSGYSACFDARATEDEQYRSYQDQALGSFTQAMRDKPWRSYTEIMGEACDRQSEWQFGASAIVRASPETKEVALAFTGHEHSEGANNILSALADHGVQASFFVTGDFLRSESQQEMVAKLINQGHYLGPHSDKHLETVSWPERKTMVSKSLFKQDVLNNLAALKRYGLKLHNIRYWIPSYETTNQETVQWSRELGLVTVNVTPGNLAHWDWMPETHAKFTPSDDIIASVLRQEEKQGLSGMIVLFHLGSGPNRTDKLAPKLGPLMTELKTRGYQLVRIDRLLACDNS